MHEHTLHGLRVRVDGDLPAALEPVGGGTPDIVVRVQRRPAWADEPLDPARTLLVATLPDDPGNLLDVGTVRGGHGIRMRFAEGATFWLAPAFDQIWLEYSAPLTGADAAYFLFEPVLAFVLRCRGVLALHASAAEFEGRAALFCGPAGSGKSTTAAACVAAGARLLSDDLVALVRRDATWLAHSGTGVIRLWDDGARVLGHDVERLPPFSPTWEKRTLTAAGPARAGVAPAPVGLLCVFGRPGTGTGAPGVERISGAQAFGELVAHTAANRLHDPLRRATELSQLAALAGTVPVARLNILPGRNRLPDLVRAIRHAMHG